MPHLVRYPTHLVMLVRRVMEHLAMSSVFLFTKVDKRL